MKSKFPHCPKCDNISKVKIKKVGTFKVRTYYCEICNDNISIQSIIWKPITKKLDIIIFGIQKVRNTNELAIIDYIRTDGIKARKTEVLKSNSVKLEFTVYEKKELLSRFKGWGLETFLK